MAVGVKMSKEDLRWQTEQDARTMANYQEIMQDKARMARAVKEANKQAQDLTRRASIMKSAANVNGKTDAR